MKLSYLDGVRAIAAFFVFASHAYLLQYGGYPHQLPTDALLYPHLAVEIFITLSGFCLGYAASQRHDTYWQFVWRRCKRILPAYYGAMLLSGLIFLGAFSYGHGVPAHAIAVNALLLGDLFPKDILFFAPPFWTVGIEFRLYFLFPAFLWLYRKAGTLPTVGSAIAASSLWYLIAVNLTPDFAQRWHYAGVFFPVLFVLGLIASQRLKSSRVWVGCFVSFMVLAIVLAANLITARDGYVHYLRALPAIDLIAGIFTAFLLSWLRCAAFHGQKKLTFLSWDPLVKSAGWSYSLYLMHFPLLKLANLWLSAVGVYGWQAIALETVPVLGLCWLFSQVFERPYLRKRQA